MKIGICGTGDISHVFMKSAIDLNLKINSIYHYNIDKAKSFSIQYDINHYFNEINDFLNSDIDIIYIGLPNHLHYEYAKKCILKCKHVLLEKTVTKTLYEFNELIDLAKEYNVYLLEVDRVEHLPAYQKIKEIYQDIDMIQIDFCKRSRRYDDYLNGELPHIFDINCVGGALYDLGVYALHFVIGLLDEPKKAQYISKIGKGYVDMYGILIMEYDHCLVNISLSKISHGTSRVLLHGNDLQIISNSAPSKLDTLMINHNEIEYYDNNFTCFLRKAIDIIENKKEIEYEELTIKSKKVIKIIEKLTKENYEIL